MLECLALVKLCEPKLHTAATKIGISTSKKMFELPAALLSYTTFLSLTAVGI